MTDEEVAVKFEGHEHEIRSMKHRIIKLEEQTNTTQDLVVSVKELAINMGNMIDEQKSQNTRIGCLENKPARLWDAVEFAAIGSIVGAIVVYFIK